MESWIATGFILLIGFMAISTLLNKSPVLAVIILCVVILFFFSKTSPPTVPTKPPVTQQQPQTNEVIDFWKWLQSLPIMNGLPDFSLSMPSFSSILGLKISHQMNSNPIGSEVWAVGLPSENPSTVLSTFCTNGYSVTFQPGTLIYQIVQGEQTLYFQYGTATITGVCNAI